jgi:hypothetical protein
MNKKLLIGGAVVVSGLALWFYLKSKSKGTRPNQPPTPQQQQNSQERQKIYDEIYIKMMSFDTKSIKKYKPIKDLEADRPMTSNEIYETKKIITDKYNFILTKLNKLSIDELKYYQVIANAISDSENGNNSTLDSLMNDPIKFRQLNDFTTKHADLFD